MLMQLRLDGTHFVYATSTKWCNSSMPKNTFPPFYYLFSPLFSYNSIIDIFLLIFLSSLYESHHWNSCFQGPPLMHGQQRKQGNLIIPSFCFSVFFFQRDRISGKMTAVSCPLALQMRKMLRVLPAIPCHRTPPYTNTQIHTFPINRPCWISSWDSISPVTKDLALRAEVSKQQRLAGNRNGLYSIAPPLTDKTSPPLCVTVPKNSVHTPHGSICNDSHTHPHPFVKT